MVPVAPKPPPRRVRLALAALALVASGCMASAVQIAPSLAPVDAARPLVRYLPIQGSACASYVLYVFGTSQDLLPRALWEMKRLTNVDGYLEVTVEEQVYPWLLGYTKCVTATGYPFTYGAEPRVLQVRREGAAHEAPPSDPGTGPRAPSEPRPDEASPAPTDPPPSDPIEARPTARRAPGAPSPLECTMACEAFGRAAGATTVLQQAVMEKCNARCLSGDTRYYGCVQRARTSSDVKACQALPRPR